MSGSNPSAPTPTGNCWYCKGNHPKENGCPEWTKKIQCKLCFRKGHNASQCHRTQVLKCYLCKKIGHTSAKCRLRSSDIDKAVKVGDHNAIEAEVAPQAQLMNIGRRSHTSTTLAPKRGGARWGEADSSPAHSSEPPAGGSPAHGTKAVNLPHLRFNKKTGKYVQRHLQSACNSATWIFRSSSIQNIATCSAENIEFQSWTQTLFITKPCSLQERPPL